MGTSTTSANATTSATTSSTVTLTPFAVDLLWEGHTCSPATSWLGVTSTAEERARLCMDAPKQHPMFRIVWVKDGDKNCKCAADDCTQHGSGELFTVSLQPPPQPRQR